MGKTAAPTVSAILKEIRSLLDERVSEKVPSSIRSRAALKVLGVPPSAFSPVVLTIQERFRGTLDYETAVGLVDGAMSRKVREEILVAIEILAQYRTDFTPSLVLQMDKWLGAAEDLDVAHVMGNRIGGPALVLDLTKLTTVRKWARFRNAGRRRLALTTVSFLISEGRRDVPPVLEICEILLNEDHPVLVGEVAALLKAATKVESKAVQDFLFRRSIDGNPEILRAGSENLDAARRAALIAKLEAQSGVPPVAAAGR